MIAEICDVTHRLVIRVVSGNSDCIKIVRLYNPESIRGKADVKASTPRKQTDRRFNHEMPQFAEPRGADVAPIQRTRVTPVGAFMSHILRDPPTYWRNPSSRSPAGR
jgi:hypothetical protein